MKVSHFKTFPDNHVRFVEQANFNSISTVGFFYFDKMPVISETTVAIFKIKPKLERNYR